MNPETAQQGATPAPHPLHEHIHALERRRVQTKEAKEKAATKTESLELSERLIRIERAIGIAIRQGQADGLIRGKIHGNKMTHLPSPYDFVPMKTLAGSGKPDPGIYTLVDGVTDEMFEAALAEAKAEGKLFRMYVVERIRLARGDGPIERRTKAGEERRDNPFLHKARRFDHNRAFSGVVLDLTSTAEALELIEVASVSDALTAEWAEPLSEAVRTINRFNRQIQQTQKENTQP